MCGLVAVTAQSRKLVGVKQRLRQYLAFGFQQVHQEINLLVQIIGQIVIHYFS